MPLPEPPRTMRAPLAPAPAGSPDTEGIGMAIHPIRDGWFFEADDMWPGVSLGLKVERVLPDGRYDVVIPITGLTVPFMVNRGAPRTDVVLSSFQSPNDTGGRCL